MNLLYIVYTEWSLPQPVHLNTTQLYSVHVTFYDGCGWFLHLLTCKLYLCCRVLQFDRVMLKYTYAQLYSCWLKKLQVYVRLDPVHFVTGCLRDH